MKRNDFVKLTEDFNNYSSIIPAGSIGRILHLKEKGNVAQVTFRDTMHTCMVSVRKLVLISHKEAGCYDPNVGDIYASHWGYEQVNVSFYKVTAISNKSATLVQIGSKRVYTAPMQGKCTPDLTTECNPSVKRIQYTTKGTPCFKMNSYEVAYPSSATSEHNFSEWH